MSGVLDVLVPAVGAVSVAGHVVAAGVVARLRAGLGEARRRANTDSLTGLANRAGLGRVLDELAGESYDLVLVDLDGFKPVNDTYGHAAGDALLVEIARRLAGVLDGIDGAVAARLGGDEFVLASPSPAPTAAVLAADVIRVLADPIDVGAATVTVRASIGAVHTARGEDPSRVLAAADAAAYEVKARGGDGMVEHSPLGELPGVEQRPMVRMREMAALMQALGVAG